MIYKKVIIVNHAERKKYSNVNTKPTNGCQMLYILLLLQLIKKTHLLIHTHFCLSGLRFQIIKQTFVVYSRCKRIQKKPKLPILPQKLRLWIIILLYLWENFDLCELIITILFCFKVRNFFIFNLIFKINAFHSINCGSMCTLDFKTNENFLFILIADHLLKCIIFYF